jgi:putative endonuclease
MPYVYILRCADGTYYTGWAVDVARRVATHNAGRGARYTQTRRPVTLVYQEEAADRAAAMKREAHIKRYSRQQKERLVRGGS